MSEPWEALTHTFAADLQRVFAGRLLSVVVYGHGLDQQIRAPLPSFVLVSSLSLDDLEACAHLAGQWARGGIDTPLILPEEEFRRSLDTFPLEYADMLDAHAVVFGRDPFTDVVINAEDLRRACEKQIKSHLLHMREGYIQAHGDPLAVAHLVSDSTPAFAALLRNVARLFGVTAAARADTALAGARAARLDDAVARQVLSLEGTTARTADGARLFPAYLDAVNQLAGAVDTWRP